MDAGPGRNGEREWHCLGHILVPQTLEAEVVGIGARYLNQGTKDRPGSLAVATPWRYDNSFFFFQTSYLCFSCCPLAEEKGMIVRMYLHTYCGAGPRYPGEGDAEAHAVAG